jgi:hypothetical protein
VKLDGGRYLESRSVKPTTLLWAIVGINVILGMLVLLFPENGISIGKYASLKFVSIEELVGNTSPEKSDDIKQILSGVKLNNTRDSQVSDSLLTLDSIQSRIVKEVKTSVNYDTVKQRLVPPKFRSIQLPPNNPNALKTLIKALKEESKSKVVRILHYGDSQLEGDRITDYLRNRFQQLFGGNGPGIVLPLEPAANSRISVFVAKVTILRKRQFI